MKPVSALTKKLRTYNPVTAIIITIGGFFAAQFFAALVLIFYGMIRGLSPEQITSDLSSSAWLTTLFGLIVYGFYFFLIKSFLEWCGSTLRDIGLKLTKSWFVTLGYIIAGFAVYFLSQIIVTIIIKNNVHGINLDQKQELGFDTNTAGFSIVPIFISLVVLPPIVEEIATRGFLYTGLRKKLNFFWAGLVTSIIFGAAHLQWGGSAPLLWAAAIDTFILSWVLVYLREKTGSIYPTIGLHMLKNFIAFLGLFVFHLA